MEIKEIRKKTEEELQKLLKAEREQLRDLRFKISSKQHKDVRDLRSVRHSIAHILTVSKEKQIIKKYQAKAK